MKVYRLSWKDDAFRLYNWATYSGTQATSDGDFIYIPAGSVVYRRISPTMVPANIYTIDMRARYVGASSELTISLLTTLPDGVTLDVLHPVFTTTPLLDINGTPLGTTGVNSSTYAYYTTGPVNVPSAISGIALTAVSNEIDLDYICFTYLDFLDVGGSRVDVTINKRTPVLRIPSAFDVIQQLGIGSRSEVFLFPKVGRNSFNWFENLVRANYPVECISPTFQATGFMVDASANTGAGWVGIGADFATTAPAQLYDVTTTFVKADRDVDSMTVTMGANVFTIHVVSSVGGTDIVGATVTIAGPTTASLTTNSSGNAPFVGVPSGSYTVTVSATGFSTWSGTIVYNGASQTFTINLTPAAASSISKTAKVTSTVGLSVSGISSLNLNYIATVGSSVSIGTISPVSISKTATVGSSVWIQETPPVSYSKTATVTSSKTMTVT